MAKLYLVRHGKAAASWQDDPDPSLPGQCDSHTGFSNSIHGRRRERNVELDVA